MKLKVIYLYRRQYYYTGWGARVKDFDTGMVYLASAFYNKKNKDLDIYVSSITGDRMSSETATECKALVSCELEKAKEIKFDYEKACFGVKVGKFRWKRKTVIINEVFN